MWCPEVLCPRQAPLHHPSSSLQSCGDGSVSGRHRESLSPAFWEPLSPLPKVDSAVPRAFAKPLVQIRLCPVERLRPSAMQGPSSPAAMWWQAWPGAPSQGTASGPGPPPTPRCLIPRGGRWTRAASPRLAPARFWSSGASLAEGAYIPLGRSPGTPAEARAARGARPAGETSQPSPLPCASPSISRQ